MKFSALALSAVSVLAVCALTACGDTDVNPPFSPEPGLSSEGDEPGLSSEGGNSELGNSSTETSSASNRCDDPAAWDRANLTNYESYPEEGSEECIKYNGCKWAGRFAGVSGQQTEEWVMEHNIVAVHEKDWDKYKQKTLRLRQNGYTIDVQVLDECGDKDCDNCCTKNATKNGLNFLIDIEKYTRAKFNGQGSGIVEWCCVDCEEEPAVSGPANSSATATTSSSSAAAADTVWNKANLTWYTSWPEPGSEEWEDYNGGTWCGYFAGVSGQQTEEWVAAHNIIAVHEKDWNTYKLKTLRLKQNGHVIDAVVYDKCADSDCSGCCTQNANQHGYGFLIDIESYSCERFTGRAGDCDGMVQWTCLDCD